MAMLNVYTLDVGAAAGGVARVNWVAVVWCVVGMWWGVVGCGLCGGGSVWMCVETDSVCECDCSCVCVWASVCVCE